MSPPVAMTSRITKGSGTGYSDMPDSFQAYIRYRRVYGQYVLRSDHDMAKQQALMTLDKLTCKYLDRAASQKQRHLAQLQKKDELIDTLRDKVRRTDQSPNIPVIDGTSTAVEYISRSDHEASNVLALEKVDALEKKYQVLIEKLESDHEAEVFDLLGQVAKLESLAKSFTYSHERLLTFEREQNVYLRERLALYEPSKDFHRTYESRVKDRFTPSYDTIACPDTPKKEADELDCIVRQCPLLKYSFIDLRVLTANRLDHRVRDCTIEEARIDFDQLLLTGDDLCISGVADGLRVLVGGTEHIVSFFVVSQKSTCAPQIWLSDGLTLDSTDLAVAIEFPSDCTCGNVTLRSRAVSFESFPGSLTETESLNVHSSSQDTVSANTQDEISSDKDVDLVEHSKVLVDASNTVVCQDSGKCFPLMVTNGDVNIAVAETGAAEERPLDGSEVRTKASHGDRSARFLDSYTPSGASGEQVDSTKAIGSKHKLSEEQHNARRQRNALTAKWTELDIVLNPSAASTANTNY